MQASSDARISLIEPGIARALPASADFYRTHGRWHCPLLLIMPDHIHALLSFPGDSRMSRVVGEWKHYQTRVLGIQWQVNFFDRRQRTAREAAETYAYILNNPVAKGLCKTPDDWPWVLR